MIELFNNPYRVIGSSTVTSGGAYVLILLRSAPQLFHIDTRRLPSQSIRAKNGVKTGASLKENLGTMMI